MAPTTPPDNELRQDLMAALLRLEEMLKPLPGTAGLREKMADLRRLLVEQRAPRVALVGRRGSGKSSLVNALFGRKVAELGHEKAQTGAGVWWQYGNEQGTLEVLDTRGLQEGSRPAEPDSAKTPADSILDALKEKVPDAILFLIGASGVDAAVDEDVKQLTRISAEIDSLHGTKTPLIAVVTHCDEVEPKNVKLHDPGSEVAEDLAEKLAHIEAIKRNIEGRLRAAPGLRERLVVTVGVSAYQSWRQDESCRADERWQIDKLVSYLFHELPREAQVELARVARVRRIQNELATSLTHSFAGACAAVAAVPIPIGDILPITTLQVTLVVSIGYVSGRNLTMAVAAEFLAALGANVGAGFVLREAARAIVKFVLPAGGMFVSSGIAYAGTVAIGKAAAAYFIEGADKAKAKSAFDAAYDQAKNEKP
jgi:uncharacterized protein (DUF697 family)/GTP-binding protein EngB required for normal cell division